MSNGGADKAGGTGGVDKADQDGNNGSGNDSDCEDDNNGVGTPGSCAAHASNAERTAARERHGSSTQTSTSTDTMGTTSGGPSAMSTETTVSTAGHARASARASARAGVREQRDQVRTAVLAGAMTKQHGRDALAQLRTDLAAHRDQLTEARALLTRIRSEAHASGDVDAAVAAQHRTSVGAQAKLAARRAVEQVRAELRAGTLTKSQAEEQVAAVRAQLRGQVAALHVTAALQRREILAATVPGTTVPGATVSGTTPSTTVPWGTAALPTTVTASSASETAETAQTAPSSDQVLGTRFGATRANVAASRVPASARSATSFAGVTAPSAATAGVLPQTGPDAGEPAGIAGIGLGAVAAGAALTLAGRRRTASASTSTVR